MTSSRIDRIRTLLQMELQPTQLEIIDESAKHIGHVGAAGGAGHFQVHIKSEQFLGKSTIACHRLVYQALDSMMIKDIHALSILIQQ